MATVYRFMNVLEEIGALRWKNGYQFQYNQEGGGRLLKVTYEDGKVIFLDKDTVIRILEKDLNLKLENKGKIKDIIPVDEM